MKGKEKKRNRAKNKKQKRAKKNTPKIVRNIRDNMEFLELPGGGTHHPSSETRHCGRAQVDEVEDDLISFRDPGHRAGPGGLD